MNEPRKSDSPVVPAKPPNNASAAEAVEERGLTKENTIGTTRPEPRVGLSVSQGLDRVRTAARRDKRARFTALLHHVDVDRLTAAFLALRRQAAPGVDHITWADYEQNLEANLRDLHTRLHRGSYQPKPSRRAYIPKADGRPRPLGIAALEDKIVQRAVVEVLNAIYETDFYGFSYGCRPGRSPHKALDALHYGIKRKKVNWILDADLRDFFTSFDHGWLMKFVEHRIGDTRVLRLIQKWLKAGVIEDGNWTEGTVGVAQGASVSPLLANIYLHYAFDQWAHQWRKRHASGDVVIVRYVDDVVVGFQTKWDAKQFLRDLRERLARFALELHPEKTRLIRFGRYAAQQASERQLGKLETFDFLGFTHICAKTESGGFYLKRITMRKRMHAKLREVRDQLEHRRYLPIPAQGKWLRSILLGHYHYFAVPGNIFALGRFQYRLKVIWLKALRRRSHRHHMPWTRMQRLADKWLPEPKILHPYAEERFAAIIQGKSPVQ